MKPEEATKVASGVAIVSAYFRDDEAGFELLANDYIERINELADASVLTAIVFAELLAPLQQLPFRESLHALEPVEVGFLPEVSIEWDAVVDIAIAVKEGSADLLTVTSRIDVPTAVKSAFGLAISAAQRLEALSEVPATQWCTIIATGLAKGVGIE